MFTIASLECNLLNMFMKLVGLSDTLRYNRRGIKSHKVIDKEDIKENLKKEESEKPVENELGERQKLTK